ncbi:unnamed protein product, partial [Mesorhabditis belari]|uniref:Uncharacterized protein n=1 Tax=Mesorhabditis belari TaxID=2138241 RepID=A0AAF3FC79_9BILA
MFPKPPAQRLPKGFGDINPDHQQYNAKDVESVQAKIAVPADASINHPDIRLLARLAVAMVQDKAYKGTDYESVPLYRNRPQNHVDMPFPTMEELIAVINKRKEIMEEERKYGKQAKLDAEHDSALQKPKQMPKE